MRWSSLYLEGLGSHLPEGREDALAQVVAGHLPAVDQEKTGQRSVVVSGPDETAPDLAVAAGRRALADAGLTPQVHGPDPDIKLLVHAVVLHNGLEAWNAGGYIAREVGLPDVLPVEIRTACAGAIVGIEMVGRWTGGVRRGLVTASDAWRLPLFDRWVSDTGLAYGDAGAAAVVGPGPGPFRVLSTSVVSDSRLEHMHRGDARLDMPLYDGPQQPMRLADRVAAFDRETGIDEFWTRNAAAVKRCVDVALADAHTDHADVHTWVVPNFGKVLLRKQVLEPLGLRPEQTLAERGLTLGHTGAADPLLGLDHLRATGALAPGDRVVLLGIGVGFTWGSAVVEFTGTEGTS